MKKTFKAFVVESKGDQFKRSIKERALEELPENNVLIEVHYSALNYKDALSATGNKGVTRNYPHTPGVDAAGVVVKSDDERFSSGDKVVVTGYDLGMNTSGGFGQYIRVPADWIVPLPEGLNLRESMMIGTAGFTAAHGVYQIIENEIASANTKKALVTGATGGVGSLAVSLLALNNFEVIAATGKVEQKEFLRKIGASEVIHREEVYVESDKPLLSRRWDVVLETVGGKMLDAAIRQTSLNGTVACCGNILGGELHTSIYPFILRGVNLAGINSATCSMPLRKKLWKLLAKDWKPESLEEICRECSLEELDEEIDKILKGGQVGKVVISLN